MATSFGSVPELIDDGRTGFVRDEAKDLAPCLLDASNLDRSMCREVAETRFSTARILPTTWTFTPSSLNDQRRSESLPYGGFGDRRRSWRFLREARSRVQPPTCLAECRHGRVRGVNLVPTAGNVEQLEPADVLGQRGVDDEVVADWFEPEHRPKQQQWCSG